MRKLNRILLLMWVSAFTVSAVHGQQTNGQNRALSQKESPENFSKNRASEDTPEAGKSSSEKKEAEPGRSWLAGDHHIHSHFSAGYDKNTDPPTPNFDEQPYSIITNAEKAREYGLSWMVSTDHGGPNHSKINLEHAYPELLQSRIEIPEVIQFHGMEFDAPAAGHASLIIPHSDHEHQDLYEIERRYATREEHPQNPERDTEEKMLEALRYMNEIALPPVVIANHPSRGAKAKRTYAQKDPQELRRWNNTAPKIAVGMEGAPGHQAGNLKPDGSLDMEDSRPYGNQTMGGFDQMTAHLGGFWDSMLGEGRHWWITSTSDSHRNWRDGGSDFWPGEYSKTYVFAEKNYDDILEGIRNGRVFVTTGDLISELHLKAVAGREEAGIGEHLSLEGNSDVELTIRIRVPETPNAHGDLPEVARVDLIVGEITGPVAVLSQDINPTTQVVKRFTAQDWKKEGDYITMSYRLRNIHHSSYLRVRGTNTQELEPEVDQAGESPWDDLWFYSNPIFLEIK